MRQYYEIRLYRFLSSGHRIRFGEFVEQALIPAYERLRIAPVGAFTGVYGPDSASLYVLIPHPDLESAVGTRDKVLADREYLDAGKSFLETDGDQPAYHRYESRLLRAFTGMPRLELQTGHLERKDRIYEIRCYESHSRRAALKKIEMFNEGGEIDIFRRTGLSPVLFGETLFGPRMPNLVYMLGFDNMAHRDRAWESFRNHPDWAALRSDPQYANTVSTITDVILAPTENSRI